MGETLNIPISKAGKGEVLVVDKELVNMILGSNQDVAAAIIFAGLKELLNSSMGKQIQAPSKLTGQAYEDNKALALAQAQSNLDDLVAGHVKKGKTSSATKAEALLDDEGNKVADAGAVLTRAKQKAKEVVKNELRKLKITISHVPPKDITAKAVELVREDPSYIQQARAELLEQAKVEAAPTVDFSTLKVDPTRVAKAKKAAADKKPGLSAKQAGLTAKKPIPARKDRPMTAAQAEGHTAH